MTRHSADPGPAPGDGGDRPEFQRGPRHRRGSDGSSPTRAQALAALGLDVTYTRGAGSRLWYGPGDVPVWDFLGGYGATFFGHNHPELKQVIADFLLRDGVIHAQGSCRSASDRLRAVLGEHLRASFGQEYQIVLASTGAEAVEVAAKHAEIVWATARTQLRARLGPPSDSAAFPESSEQRNGVSRARGVHGSTADRDQTSSGGGVASARGDQEPGWSDAARVTLEGLGLLRTTSTIASIEDHNRRVLRRPPVFVALRGSFHGMTDRARSLTHDPSGRLGPRVTSARVLFIGRDEPGALAKVLSDRTKPIVIPRPEAGGWEVETIDSTDVAAFFFEPIQGEGGIHPIEAETASGWATACRAHGIPIVADEIQTGMGRTGSFLFCEQLGLSPDYLLLGKSLGGGLAKISAVAISDRQYRGDFSLRHSSTFAEDDLSSLVALRALELLRQEDAFFRATRTGEQLLRDLTSLAARFPAQIREVRGRGLMVGIEWRHQRFEQSHALRFLQEYGWLGYALSAYLLRKHGLRVAPPLSRTAMIRLEPAYSVPEKAVDDLIRGLEKLCFALERQDSKEILGPGLVDEGSPLNGQELGESEEGGPPPVHHPDRTQGMRERAPHREVPPLLLQRVRGPHVAFIGHFIDAGSVGLWDAGLGRLGAAACRTFLERGRPLAEPLLCHRERVESSTGATTTLSFIGIPVSSEQCHAAVRDQVLRRELRALIQRAVDLAAREGCSVVGLGGYCSILTRNGRWLSSGRMRLTTGNGYTVGSGLLALRERLRMARIDPADCRAAVIGALGNIGSIFAEILAGDVRCVVLVGREARRADLEAAAGRLLIRMGRDAPASAVGRALRGSDFGTGAGDHDLRAAFHSLTRALGDHSPVAIATSTRACSDADLIVSASNSPTAILYPEDVGAGATAILDLAVPGDVHPSVLDERPGAALVRGGVIRTPRNPEWKVPGIGLEPGEMFACMAETVLMGLEQASAEMNRTAAGGRHPVPVAGGLGSITIERVLGMIELAHRHGFDSVRPAEAISPTAASNTVGTSSSERPPAAPAPGPSLSFHA